MVWSRPVNVGFAWCCESVSECGVGVSGTQDCCHVVGSPGASQLPAPTDPGVTVSRHRALLTGLSVRADPLPVGK